mmetsp:Transcript_44446/g.76844  ORF Transcript_44446/g.76844 Transcript_44446/m.76844 type:complete len:111 (+) Transcript_44446:39-371(+)
MLPRNVLQQQSYINCIFLNKIVVVYDNDGLLFQIIMFIIMVVVDDHSANNWEKDQSSGLRVPFFQSRFTSLQKYHQNLLEKSLAELEKKHSASLLKLPPDPVPPQADPAL